MVTKKAAAPASKKAAKKSPVRPAAESDASRSRFPRHPVGKCIRIAKAILEQNAGRACTPTEAAAFLGVGISGDFNVEISSALKYGLLERPSKGQIQPTALGKRILRPQSSNDEVEGFRQAVLQAPDIAQVYGHYRGENLPDDQFFKNTVAESYGIAPESFLEFKRIFLECLEAAQLVDKHGDKVRVLDVSSSDAPSTATSERLKKLGRSAHVSATDTCFVMQPFAAPLGDYYEKIYRPAIEKAGLKSVRADAEIFATGKIMDQVWEGITSAKVLVAELTSRNPNVFYELGLAHALEKPVVTLPRFDVHQKVDNFLMDGEPNEQEFTEAGNGAKSAVHDRVQGRSGAIGGVGGCGTGGQAAWHTGFEFIELDQAGPRREVECGRRGIDADEARGVRA